MVDLNKVNSFEWRTACLWPLKFWVFVTWRCRRCNNKFRVDFMQRAQTAYFPEVTVHLIIEAAKIRFDCQSKSMVLDKPCWIYSVDFKSWRIHLHSALAPNIWPPIQMSHHPLWFWIYTERNWDVCTHYEAHAKSPSCFFRNVNIKNTYGDQLMAMLDINANSFTSSISGDLPSNW